MQQEQIQKKQRGNPTWQKGQSGNPAGRPLGSRNKIAENVLTSFSLVTGEDAERSLRELRDSDPGKFWQIAASLLPREVAMTVQQSLPGNLDPESYGTLRRVVELIDRLAPATDPQSVFETLERALMAAYGAPQPEPLQITHQRALPAPMVLAPPPYSLQNS
jgi:uncharacterized protein DUF5681